VVLLRSWRFSAAFFGFAVVYALLYRLEGANLVEPEVFIVALLAGGLGALLLRDHRPIAAGLGCSVVAIVVGFFFVLVLASLLVGSYY
jgi:hypothetical protein